MKKGVQVFSVVRWRVKVPCGTAGAEKSSVANLDLGARVGRRLGAVPCQRVDASVRTNMPSIALPTNHLRGRMPHSNIPVLANM